VKLGPYELNSIITGDCLDVMREFPDNCIDTVITDPPYGLSFMGKNWDYGLPGEIYWREALRVAKPGATLLAFGGSRTYHRLTCAIEDAGWEIRDCIMWVYGSGFPKSHDVSKGIDKAAGAEREVVGRYTRPDGSNGRVSRQGFNPEYVNSISHDTQMIGETTLTAPATPLAAKFDGYGTALKPAHEPIVVAMKPIDGTFAANAEKWGVSGIWIDGGRVGTDTNDDYGRSPNRADGTRSCSRGHSFGEGLKEDAGKSHPKGRWPANVIWDGSEEVMAEFDKAGVRTSGARTPTGNPKYGGSSFNKSATLDASFCEASQGSAARFFAQCPPDPTAHPDAARFHYCPKAGKRERSNGNNHPTVKPLSLLRYLARLTRPPDGGIVLDPFAGSGTTALACIGEGRDYILIEKEPEYVEICKRRIANIQPPLPIEWAEQLELIT
jgi:site-specific DNA-methyltransferase (adenine-specific)